MIKALILISGFMTMQGCIISLYEDPCWEWAALSLFFAWLFLKDFSDATIEHYKKWERDYKWIEDMNKRK